MQHDAFGHVPRPAIIGAAVLIASTICIAAVARLAHLTSAWTPQDTPVAARSLNFNDGQDGSVEVVDSRTHGVVQRLAPGTNGFLRAIMRSLTRERRAAGIGSQTPFLLQLRSSGRVTLDDPATDRHVELNAFGHTNAQIFANLLGDSPHASNAR